MSFILWGIGKRGNNLWPFIADELRLVVDNSASKHNCCWHGYCVINSEEYVKRILPDDIVVISPQSHCKDIMQFCVEHSVKYLAYEEFIQESFLARINRYRDTQCEFDIEKIFSAKRAIVYMSPNYDVLRILLNDRCTHVRSGIFDDELLENVDLVIMHGLSADYNKLCFLDSVMKKNINLCICEDGFIRSIVTNGDYDYVEEYRRSHSVVLDCVGLYIDANKPSHLELLLNSEIELSESSLMRTKVLIKKIINAQLSKYNNQFHIEDFSKYQTTKILVVDQVCNDMSVVLGHIDREKFMNMITVACQENPDADIFIKIHPDIRHSFYGEFKNSGNVHIIDSGYNPIALINLVDKVYVGTSQLGFEACMCGKEVHVFGMPFYAGWGFTHDRQNCSRRTRKRSVEEVFYFAYILYSHYVSYKTNSICEIEQCIEEIIELRDEYFLSKNNMGMNI